MQIRPLLAFWNKDYGADTKTQALRSLLINFANSLIDWAGDEADSDSHGFVKYRYFYGDDLFVSLRNCGFLEDEFFRKALAEHAGDPILRGRIWRVWILCWSLSTRWGEEGAILDCGTYNGKAFLTACRYSRLKTRLTSRSGNIICADLFEDPPEEARKSEHGPTLYSEVVSRFEEIPNAKVLKGYLPEALYNEGVSSIAWAQIDLNSAASDLAVFMHIYPKLAKGAHVIFDDYGFSRYNGTQIAIDTFLCDKPERVLEMPTGQGLLIKA